MTESSEQIPVKKDSPKESVPPPNKSSGIFATLIAVLALVLVAGAAYFGYQQHILLTDRLAVLEQQGQQGTNQYQELQQKLNIISRQNQQTLADQQAQFDADMTGLTNQLLLTSEKIATLAGTSEQSWHLDEAYYLLRIANNRLLFLTDINTALSLLKQADAILAEMDDPELFLSRKKLAEDIQRLTAYPRLDRTGIAIRVGALQAKVAELPMVLLTQGEEIPEEESVPLPQTWYEHLSASFDQLTSQWFDVRHHGDGYNPMISEQDERQLRFAMMMTLQTIQYAILHRNNDLFHASLLQLKSRLTNYFDVEDSQVRSILIEAEQLLAIQVSPQEVEPLGSLSALNTYRMEEQSPASAQETEQPSEAEVGTDR